MAERSDDTSPDQDAAPEVRPPAYPIGAFAAVGYLLPPATALELSFVAVDQRYPALGLVMFPLSLSWLVVMIVKVCRSYRG